MTLLRAARPGQRSGYRRQFSISGLVGLVNQANPSAGPVAPTGANLPRHAFRGVGSQFAIARGRGTMKLYAVELCGNPKFVIPTRPGSRKRTLATRSSIAALALLLLLAGCQQATRLGSATAPPAGPTNWDAYDGEFLESSFVAQPDLAVWTGRHEFDG